MTDGIRYRERGKFLQVLDDGIQSGGKLHELSTDNINMLELLRLIVDIEYRQRYGDGSAQAQNSSEYNEVPADQLSPVEEVGSAGLRSTGGICGEV